jgi:hypothetical protein
MPLAVDLEEAATRSELSVLLGRARKKMEQLIPEVISHSGRALYVVDGTAVH